MRIAGLVREGVVLAMVRHPLRERPLHRHAAEHPEHDLDRTVRLEAAVREVAMEPDGGAEGAEDVEGDEQRDVDPAEGRAPERDHRKSGSEERHDHGDERDHAADAAGLVSNRSDGCGRTVSAHTSSFTLY